jgi:hypothetical protein
MWRAPRLAWTLLRGEIPVGLSVCHRCDTPLCVNPDHLFLGTQRDNMYDAIAKGRLKMPPVGVRGKNVIKNKPQAFGTRRIANT